jgi:DNA-binding NarL/FixJ family response regulator
MPIFNERGAVTMNRKGVIVATGERLIFDWLCRYLQKVIDSRYVLIHASNESDFSTYVQRQGITIVFVETVFFGEAVIGNLDFLSKQYPSLRFVFFTVSDFPSDAAGRYLCWGGDSFISLRDTENRILKRLKIIFEGKYLVPQNVQKEIAEYSRISEIPPHLTGRECEIVRLIAREKEAKEMASLLKISKRTVDNHLHNIRKKFGVKKDAGILKLAVSRGILPVEELMAYR